MYTERPDDRSPLLGRLFYDNGERMHPQEPHIHTSGTTKRKEVKAWYSGHGRHRVPAVLGPEDHRLACILPDGQDLPMSMALNLVSFGPKVIVHWEFPRA